MARNFISVTSTVNISICRPLRRYKRQWRRYWQRQCRTHNKAIMAYKLIQIYLTVRNRSFHHNCTNIYSQYWNVNKHVDWENGNYIKIMSKYNNNKKNNKNEMRTIIFQLIYRSFANVTISIQVELFFSYLIFLSKEEEKKRRKVFFSTKNLLQMKIGLHWHFKIKIFFLHMKCLFSVKFSTLIQK